MRLRAFFGSLGLVLLLVTSVQAAPPDGYPPQVTITMPTASGLGTSTLTWEDDGAAYTSDASMISGGGGINWGTPGIVFDPVGDGSYGYSVPAIVFSDGGSGEYDVTGDSWTPSGGLVNPSIQFDPAGWGLAGFQLGEAPPPAIPEPASLSMVGLPLLLLLRRRSRRMCTKW